MKKSLILIASAFLCIFSAGCSKNAENEASSSKELRNFKTIEDLNKSGVNLGVLTGSAIFDATAHKFFPNAERHYFNTTIDMAKLVSTGTLDAMIVDEPVARRLCNNMQGLDYIRKILEPTNYAFAFPKTKKGSLLCSQMNEFLKKIKSDGRMEKYEDIWLGTDDSKKNIDLSHLEAKNGIIRSGTFSQYPLFSYLRNNKTVGYDIAMIVDFCSEYGYGLTTTDYDMNGLISALISTSIDCAANGLTVTDERKENMNFSIPNYDGGTVALIKSNKDKSGTKNAESSVKYKALSDFNNPAVTLGIRTGTMIDILTEKNFPLAKTKYYNSTPDMVLSTFHDELDGFLADEPTIRYIAAEDPKISYLKEFLEKQDYGFIFPKTEKGEALQKQMNEFLHELKSKGTLSEIDSLWFSSDDSKKKVDYESLSGTNGEINLVIDSATPPFDYMVNNKYAGYEVDIATRFCLKYGYTLKITDTQFASVMTGVVSGAYDIGASVITITEERKEKVLFSDPVYSGGIAMAAKKENIAEQNATNTTAETSESEETGLISSIATSFEKTFIRESRWKLIVSGIFTTVLISVLSALLGTLLGFGLCALRLSKNPIVNGVTLAYIRLMQGLPMLVLLMILFYIVFAKSGVSGIFVAVIGFGMNFGAYVSEMIRTGILAVDKGQTEAALALGYKKSRAFVKVVLPQAARHFLPVYQGEFISLVKMTSVVGYIAIQDLTKAGDIIRSRTYEAFFPLITTAFIYFLISWLLTRVLTALQNKLDPKRRRIWKA